VDRDDQDMMARLRVAQRGGLELRTKAMVPRHAREAVARHEQVVVENHERPTFVIMHPDDTAAGLTPARRGRTLREALGLLAVAALPDPCFADDMEAVLADAGPVPDDPWARS
jgi:hypothetical protein